jgi:phospholipid/cholesterol/gamma-HCH transport system permease protein
MDTPADFSVQDEGGGRTVVLTGDWTAQAMGGAGAELREALKEESSTPVTFDLLSVKRVDTAGAYNLLAAIPQGPSNADVRARPETERLLELVRAAVALERPVRRRPWSFNLMMDRLGRGLIGVFTEFYETMTFNGHLLAVLGRAIVHPSRFRLPALFNIIERAGLDALPIITITNIFIGAVVGLLAANSLRDFGAEVFAVEGVGIGILREFNIVITAVLLAGRSSSSFAAEIGAMKMQQEIDAMKVMGVDPFEALVLPRFMALLIITPLLTFVASVAGLTGGALVLWSATGLSPQFFMERIVENVGIQQFWIGMSKAPVMAIVVALIGCRQGMEVGGDVESLGRRVTAAVVHAIFSIIFIDAVFALIYMELDL